MAKKVVDNVRPLPQPTSRTVETVALCDKDTKRPTRKRVNLSEDDSPIVNGSLYITDDRLAVGKKVKVTVTFEVLDE